MIIIAKSHLLKSIVTCLHFIQIFLKLCETLFLKFLKITCESLKSFLGGDLIRREPANHTTLLGDQVCLPLFQARGWTNYMLKLSAWDEELTFEFLQMLKDGVAIVRDVRVLFLPKIVVKIIELPLAGEEFLETMDLVIARA